MQKEHPVSIQDDNKAIVGRWFTNFWGKTCDLAVVDEIAAPDMLLHYSLHEPRRGRALVARARLGGAIAPASVGTTAAVSSIRPWPMRRPSSSSTTRTRSRSC